MERNFDKCILITSFFDHRMYQRQDHAIYLGTISRFHERSFFRRKLFIAWCSNVELFVETCSVINDNRNFPLLIDESKHSEQFQLAGKSTKIEVTAFKTDSGRFAEPVQMR